MKTKLENKALEGTVMVTLQAAYYRGPWKAFRRFFINPTG